MTENIIKIDINSFVDMCQKIETLTAQNEQLMEENETYFETNEALIKEIQDLKNENRNLKSRNLALVQKHKKMSIWDLSPEAQEEAGHMLARSLLGGK